MIANSRIQQTSCRSNRRETKLTTMNEQSQEKQKQIKRNPLAPEGKTSESRAPKTLKHLRKSNIFKENSQKSNF